MIIMKRKEEKKITAPTINIFREYYMFGKITSSSHLQPHAKILVQVSLPSSPSSSPLNL